jgi:hypothetical protein
MKAYAIAALVMVGLVCQHADAAVKQNFLPGSYCVGIDAASAADISYNTAGKLYNNGSVTRNVTCVVPLSQYMDPSDFVSAWFHTSVTTSCSLRFTYQDGTAAKMATASASGGGSVQLDGTGLTGLVTSNLRCAIPAGGQLSSVQIDVFDY